MPERATDSEVTGILGEFQNSPRRMASEIAKLRRELERAEYELSRVLSQKTLGQSRDQ